MKDDKRATGSNRASIVDWRVLIFAGCGRLAPQKTYALWTEREHLFEKADEGGLSAMTWNRLFYDKTWKDSRAKKGKNPRFTQRHGSHDLESVACIKRIPTIDMFSDSEAARPRYTL
jgi:hypothetical protein